MACKTLVVDDEVGIRSMLAQILSDEGHSVRTSSNGKEALEAIPGWQPNVVLTDLSMPVMDGWALVPAIKAIAPDTSVVIMSAATRGRADSALLGADAYLSKPFDLDELLEIIERLSAA